MQQPLESRRQLLQLLLGSSTLLAANGVMSPMAFASFFNVPHKLADDRSIYDIRGHVKVDGQRASLNTRVHANSLIETGSNSYIIFAVGKDAHLVRENSRLQLAGSNYVEDSLRLFTGKLLSVFGPRAKSSYALHTNVATIGIRGTGVYLEAEDDHSYVCTCYGSANITSTQDTSASELVQTQHHDAPRYILANPDSGKLIIPAPVINHTDEELMLIETIVGRTTPFSAVKGYSSPRKGY